MIRPGDAISEISNNSNDIKQIIGNFDEFVHESGGDVKKVLEFIHTKIGEIDFSLLKLAESLQLPTEDIFPRER